MSKSKVEEAMQGTQVSATVEHLNVKIIVIMTTINDSAVTFVIVIRSFIIFIIAVTSAHFLILYYTSLPHDHSVIY